MRAAGSPFLARPVSSPIRSGTACQTCPPMACSSTAYEGTPRLLNLMDKHGINVSVFMIGQAVDKNPQLANEVVRRGHEAAAHGHTWSASYDLDPDDERRFIEDNIRSIERATGVRPRGWSAYWA